MTNAPLPPAQVQLDWIPLPVPNWFVAESRGGIMIKEGHGADIQRGAWIESGVMTKFMIALINQITATKPVGSIPDVTGLDEAAAGLLMDAAITQHVHPDHHFLAGLALRVYAEVKRQGANDIETVSTVYHAGMSHIREAMGMPHDEAVAVEAVLESAVERAIDEETSAAVLAALINAEPVQDKEGAQIGVTLKLAAGDAESLRKALLAERAVGGTQVIEVASVTDMSAAAKLLVDRPAAGHLEPDNDCVICPNCTWQFPATPVNVQKELNDRSQRSAASVFVVPHDLIEQMRLLESDHTPDGWPAVRMRDITALCDLIDRLNAGNRICTHSALDGCDCYSGKRRGEVVAWYVERVAPGKRDNGMKLGPFWKKDEAESWVDERHALRSLYTAPPAPGVPELVRRAEILADVVGSVMERHHKASAGKAMPGFLAGLEEAVKLIRLRMYAELATAPSAAAPETPR